MSVHSRILIVEDDPKIVIFATDTLEYLGFQVFIARNGIDGLKMAREVKPDLIILDIMMYPPHDSWLGGIGTWRWARTFADAVG